MVAESESPVAVPAPSNPALTLDLRHRPIQKRGIERFEAILNAGRSLLSVAGLERFTIEDVAAHAGIPVGSVYQYFPNKYALVAEMAAQDTDALVSALEAAAEWFPSEDWQALTDSILQRMAQRWAADPWRAAVFAAMRSTAATRQRAAEHSRVIAGAVTKSLAPLTPSLSADQRTRVALVLVETCQPLLNLTVRDGTVDEAMLLEMQRMTRAYLRAVALGHY